MKLTKLFALILLGTIFSAAAYAQPFLLTVNVYDPNAVIITTTGAFSAGPDSSTGITNGVDLANFFTSVGVNNSSLSGSLSGSLIGGDSGVAYSNYRIDNFPGSDIDL